MKKAPYRISRTDMRALRIILAVLLSLIAVAGCLIAGNPYWLLTLVPILPVELLNFYIDDDPVVPATSPKNELQA